MLCVNWCGDRKCLFPIYVGDGCPTNQLQNIRKHDALTIYAQPHLHYGKRSINLKERRKVRAMFVLSASSVPKVIAAIIIVGTSRCTAEDCCGEARLVTSRPAIGDHHITNCLSQTATIYICLCYWGNVYKYHCYSFKNNIFILVRYL